MKISEIIGEARTPRASAELTNQVAAVQNQYDSEQNETRGVYVMFQRDKAGSYWVYWNKLPQASFNDTNQKAKFDINDMSGTLYSLLGKLVDEYTNLTIEVPRSTEYKAIYQYCRKLIPYDSNHSVNYSDYNIPTSNSTTTKAKSTSTTQPVNQQAMPFLTQDSILERRRQVIKAITMAKYQAKRDDIESEIIEPSRNINDIIADYQ